MSSPHRKSGKEAPFPTPVLQGRPCPAHRDHDRQHPRLRHRTESQQPARPARHRLCRQPPTARSGDHRPGLPPGRGGVRSGHPTAGGRRPTRPRAALRRSAGAGPVHRPASVPHPAGRVTPCPSARLRDWMAQALGVPLAAYSPGRMTYDLRRLRLHGRIERIPQSHRYRVTDLGLRVALFFTKVHSRILCPGLSQLFDGGPKAPRRHRHEPTAAGVRGPIRLSQTGTGPNLTHARSKVVRQGTLGCAHRLRTEGTLFEFDRKSKRSANI